MKLQPHPNVCTCGESFPFRDQLQCHMMSAPGHSLAVTLFTLDSHDTYGPFESKAQIHTFARDRQLTSYSIEG